MNSNKFLRRLKRKLRSLPKQERDEALRYYQELFDEAGADQEEALIKRLGQPAQLAEQILEEERKKGTHIREKKDLSRLWLTILAILAAPIALPLALALGALALALLVVVFALILSAAAIIAALIIAFLAVVLVGLVMVGVSCFIWYDWPSALFFLGFGMAAVGLGCMGSLGMLWVGRKFHLFLKKMLNALRERRRMRREKK
ncbi:MAG TPA: DUF1700 domain-containing protein [Candidatus Faecaligallichristensenella faecipullorum]|nr:DUF1700 domain-containing protein [Candidatus Faecaligallichristensenella faecipullorum]